MASVPVVPAPVKTVPTLPFAPGNWGYFQLPAAPKGSQDVDGRTHFRDSKPRTDYVIDLSEDDKDVQFVDMVVEARIDLTKKTSDDDAGTRVAPIEVEALDVSEEEEEGKEEEDDE